MNQAAARPHSHRRAYLVLALSLIGMGFSGIFVSLAGAPGAVAGFYRMGIAAVVLAVPFAGGVRREGRPNRREVWIAMLAGLFFAGDLASWNTALFFTSAANATLLGNTDASL